MFTCRYDAFTFRFLLLVALAAVVELSLPTGSCKVASLGDGNTVEADELLDVDGAEGRGAAVAAICFLSVNGRAVVCTQVILAEGEQHGKDERDPCIGNPSKTISPQNTMLKA